jgi:suppressor for copper-sensitivity B
MTIPLKIPTIPVLVSALLFLGFQVNAQEETEWVEGDFAKSRLVASHKSVPGDEDGPLYLGWQVRLEGNWKTYWRTPGSAGLPPVFSWEGSINVAGAEVLFPIPVRFEIFDLQTYGYHDEVVYPIKITPAIAGAPITLKVKVNYLVCEDLCVPVVDEFEMTLPAAKGEAPLSIHAGLIDRYLHQVPEKAAGTGEAVHLTDVSLAGVSGAQNLILTLKGEALLSGADIIVEDIEGFKFGIPKKRLLAGGNEVEFIVPVQTDLAEGNLSGETLTLIIADGWGRQEEINITVKD